MRSSFTLPLWLIATTLLLSACGNDEASSAAAGQTPPPPAAGYLTVKSQSFTLVNELPGRTTPFQVAEVRPQVTGIVEKRLFNEGDTVSAGQPLYQIDSKRYQAALASAKAELANAEASLESARLTAKRYRTLGESSAISQQEIEDADIAKRVAEARLAAAQAQMDANQIDLEYSTIRAPIDGRIGRSSVTAGALVTANQTQALVTIRQLDPIYVDLTQSYDELRALRSAMASGRLETLGEASASVTLALHDGSVYGHKGTLQFSEYAVDENTGTVALRALLPNPDGELLPGMFVRARLPQAERENAIVVPQKGISREPNGQATALVIGDNNLVEKRQVEPEKAVGNQWLIRSGLSAGDRLIVDGLQKIRVGAPVTPVDVIAEQQTLSQAEQE